jgi:hypothetical protein
MNSEGASITTRLRAPGPVAFTGIVVALGPEVGSPRSLDDDLFLAVIFAMHDVPLIRSLQQCGSVLPFHQQMQGST